MFGLIVMIVAAVVIAASILSDSLSNAGQDADNNFGDDPVGGTVAHCPNRYIWQWDPPHTSSRNQFVNLPAAWDPPNNGRTVDLQGHVEPRAGGINVTFNLIANTANEPDTPAASLGSTSVSTDGNGAATVQLTLPPYGGAKFKVGGKTDIMEAPVESGELTVWRKVFYQVTEMTDSSDTPAVSFTAPVDMIPQLQAAFDPVFFKFDPGTKSHDTTPYQEHLTATQRGQLENSLRPGAQDNRSPFKMNIVLIDHADIVAEQEWTNAATAAIVETPYFLRWTYEPTVIYAEYQTSAGTWSDLVNQASPLHPTDARFAQVSATIPGFSAGSTVNVRIKYRYQRGSAGGWGGTTGTLFMCIGNQRRANAATPTGADLQQALTHETGHALGLVPTGAGWRDTDPRDNGYSLRHCGYRTTATPPEPRCVMWYMLGGGGDRLRFCSNNRPDDCAHFLLRTDYSSISWI